MAQTTNEKIMQGAAKIIQAEQSEMDKKLEMLMRTRETAEDEYKYHLLVYALIKSRKYWADDIQYDEDNKKTLEETYSEIAYYTAKKMANVLNKSEEQFIIDVHEVRNDAINKFGDLNMELRSEFEEWGFTLKPLGEWEEDEETTEGDEKDNASD